MEREISIMGFNLIKISGSKNPEFKGDLEINPKINIKSIEEYSSKFVKEDLLKIEFSFIIDYKDYAEINLEGSIILKTDSKTMKEVLRGWKEKKIDNEVQVIILNLIMNKASIRAIELEEELGLPLHIRLPSIQLSKKD